MAWAYSSATFRGSKANPQPGHSVTVTLQDASDQDNVLEKQFTWGFDGTKSKAQFVAMVKQEVRAHVQALNGGAAAGDATSVFDPS